jgi:hypothetical protein
MAASVNQWKARNADPAALAEVASFPVRIIDLGGRNLGMAAPGVIFLDDNAGGFGWSRVNPTEVIAHEMGHLLGYEHDEHDSVMHETLVIGRRSFETAVAQAMTTRSTAALVGLPATSATTPTGTIQKQPALIRGAQAARPAASRTIDSQSLQHFFNKTAKSTAANDVLRAKVLVDALKSRKR